MKKYMIGFFSVLFLITGCLIAGYQVSYNNLLEKEKAIELTKNEKNDSIQTRRSSAKGESVSDDAYYLKGAAWICCCLSARWDNPLRNNQPIRK